MDIPPEVTKRPTYIKLSPDEERAFLREQAEYEAAYRRTGEPLALWEALSHVRRSGQTVPDWLRMEFYKFVTRATPDKITERYHERWRHIRRYSCVRDLRRQGYTKDGALDEAVLKLQGTPEGGVSRGTIENSYNRVRRSLERDGRESEFFFLVDDDDPNKGR